MHQKYKQQAALEEVPVAWPQQGKAKNCRKEEGECEACCVVWACDAHATCICCWTPGLSALREPTSVFSVSTGAIEKNKKVEESEMPRKRGKEKSVSQTQISNGFGSR